MALTWRGETEGGTGRLVESETEHGTDPQAFGEFVGPHGELASYAFGWSSDADSGRISIGIGAGNEGGGTFHAAVFENDGDIAYALIDDPFEDVPQGGRISRPPKLVRTMTFRSCGRWSTW